MKTTVRFEESIYLEARHRALDEHISFQELIERAVRMYLESEPRKEKRKNARRHK